MKNPFKKNKLSVPREIKDIQLEYQQCSLQAGQKQYHIMILTEELKELNERIRKLNNEGSARNKLDTEKKAAAAPAPAKTEETKAV